MDTKYIINKDIEINELDNELVIIVPFTEKMFYCNKLAKDIFYAIRDGLTVQKITESILIKFDIDKDTAEIDIKETINKLVAFQIIVLEE